MPIITKICGLSTREAIECAVAHGAAYLGFVFFPRSPRNISPEDAALLTHDVPASIKKVAVIVDKTDAEIEALLQHFSPDYLQLHGNESPERTAEIRARYAIPAIKSLAIRDKADIKNAALYSHAADMLLFDAKPPKDANLPGGNGVSFDWNLLRDTKFPLPWFLSGGLSCQNIREAVDISGATMVDISSGVESAPGIKDNHLIQKFLEITAL